MALSVAIIEPDMNVASTVEATFTNLGFEAHVLSDGDVVEFVRSKAPDVILLNVELPRGSGYSFCNRLKKQQDLKMIPIILTSGHETAEAFAQHQKTPTPADAYMHKPFSVDQLVDAVNRLIPEAFPNGKPAAAAVVSRPAAPSANGAPVDGPGAGMMISGEGAPVMPSPDVSGPVKGAPPLPPGRRTAGDRVDRPERSDKPGRGAGPSLDELIAQGRSEPPAQPPPNAAGPEAKLTFLRDSLRQKEGDLVRARELWANREREIAQIAEVLELRERELERARKAREDLLAQLTDTEDKVAALRLDVELGAERAERLEREKKALSDEVENITTDLERNIMQLQQRGAQLEAALRAEQTARTEENDRSSTEIRDLVNDLDRVRGDAARREAEHNEADAQARSQMAELQGRIAGLEVELENLRGKLVDAQKDNEALRRELGTLRQEKASDDERARTLVEDLEGRIRDLSFDKDSVEAELHRTGAELSDREARLHDATARITDLEAELADTQGRLSETSSDLEQSQTRAQELHNELAETQQHALELSQEKHRVELHLGETQREVANVNERLAVTQAELEETRQNAASHERELEARIQSYKDNVAALDDKLREAAEVNATLDAQLKDTQLRLEEKHRDWDQERISRQKDVLKRDQRIGDLEQRVRDLDQAAHEAERAAKQREAELSHELDLQRARGDELDRDLNRSRAKGQELEGLLEDSKGRLVELTKELKRNEARVAQLTDELTVSNERNEELTRSLGEQKERTAFVEAELAEERATHAQDVQAHSSALDRTSQAAKERVEKLQEAVQKLRADLGAQTADLQATRERLARSEDKAQKLEAGLEREQRERQQLADRGALLDGEIEGAQAKAEQLTDEVTRLKSALKRAQDELLAAKKERASVEERFRVEEQTMVKRIDEVKHSAMEAQTRVREDVDRVAKERDDARAQALEIRRKAEALMRKYKELEASVATTSSSADQKVQRLGDELRVEKETRAREAAQWRATEERLRQEMSALSTQAMQTSEVELASLKAQVRERDEKLQRAQAEYTAMREKAKDALAKLKEAGEKMKAGAGDAELKARVDQLTAKYNEAVQKLKQQAELNKKIDAAYKELAEKHRKALIMLKEHREQGANEATMVLKGPIGGG